VAAKCHCGGSLNKYKDSERGIGRNGISVIKLVEYLPSLRFYLLLEINPKGGKKQQ
jgi:hypothetical protein